MSGVAYTPTRHVRHISVWTADNRKGTKDDSHWVKGSLRAICGRQTHRNAMHVYDLDWQLNVERSGEKEVNRAKDALLLPVCKDCQSVAQTLTAFAENRTEHLGGAR